MNKEKRHNFYAIFVTAVVLAGIYLMFKLSFFDSWSPEIISDIVNPLYFGLLALIPTLMFLLFFMGRLFILWIKHVAWWFFAFTVLMVGNTSQGGFLPLYDKVQVALFWMAILFIVTVVYALIMNKRLKNENKLFA
ncbi:MAG: hypothetical protein K9M10_00225 [Candidatus Pacebacteria bacterium]|nr:hypothetical protein [Candidatus Paceibacterota bacterium]MCF7856892.1 hypothetical protein [Candidatus Paceibacterota bacterium]